MQPKADNRANIEAEIDHQISKDCEEEHAKESEDQRLIVEIKSCYTIFVLFSFPLVFVI